MRGLNQSFMDHFQYEILKRLFDFEIEEGRRTLLPMQQDFQIFAASQILPSLAQKHDGIAVVPEPLGHGPIGLIDQSDHPEHWGWIDGQAIGFVIEAYVAADDWNVEVFAGILE